MLSTLVGTPDPPPQLRRQRARVAAVMRAVLDVAPQRLRRVRPRLT